MIDPSATHAGEGDRRGMKDGGRHGMSDRVNDPLAEDRAQLFFRARTAVRHASRSSGTSCGEGNRAERHVSAAGGGMLPAALVPRRRLEGRMADPIAILFDVDGTLISTGGAGTRSWRWAFEELHGIPADIGESSEAGMTDPVVGKSTFQSVLRRDPTDAEMRSLLAAYLQRLPVEIQASESYRVLPGAEDVLRHLRRTGRLIGIVTGALEEAARIKLARGRLNRFFPFGGFGSDSADRIELTRRAIERGASLMGRELLPALVHVVGDTPRDMDAAAGVGAVPVGVTTGTYSADDLRNAGATTVIPSLKAYLALIS